MGTEKKSPEQIDSAREAHIGVMIGNGAKTGDMINALMNPQAEGIPPMKRAAANNFVRKMRKKANKYKPRKDDSTNWQKIKAVKEAKEREAAFRRESKRSNAVIKKNHSDSALEETVEAQLDRIIVEATV